MNLSVTAGHTELAYQGDELDAFAEAENWKRYWSGKLRPLIGDAVIEVGAGLGGSTRYLCEGAHSSWLCNLSPGCGETRCKGADSVALPSHSPGGSQTGCPGQSG